jgi:hypothetical protein
MTQYQRDNQMLHLEWESRFVALMMVADLNIKYYQDKNK